MPPNTSPTPPPVPENNTPPTPTPEPTAPIGPPNPVPVNNNQPFHVNSVIGPSQQPANKMKVPLLIFATVLLLGIVGAVVYFLALAPGLNNAQQESMSATNQSQLKPVTGSAVDIATDKPVVTADSITTKCFTVDMGEGMDQTKTRQSSLLGCMVAMSPVDTDDMSKYLTYNIMPHTSGESYDEAVERVSKDPNIGAINLKETTVDGAEAVVFDTLKGDSAGRQYIVKAPEGKYVYKGSETRDVTAFFIIGLFSSKNSAGATSVDNLVKSFKFAE